MGDERNEDFRAERRRVLGLPAPGPLAPRERAIRSRQAKADGLESVSSHNQEFLGNCRAFAIGHSLAHGDVTIEHVRDYAAARGLVPTHPNAWGAVFRPEVFKPIGFRQNPLESAHARMVRVWVYRPDEPAEEAPA